MRVINRKEFSTLCLGQRAPSVHTGNHVKPLNFHGAAAGDQADDDPAEELLPAEHRAAGHAGATTSVHTGQTRYLGKTLPLSFPLPSH